jgi:predicted dehydrogenase
MGQRLRAVMAGCGGISKAWLDAIADIPSLEMVGLVDLQEEAARRRAGEYGLARALVGSDLPAVLNRTTPDLVFDCTVPEAHLGVTLTALEHGCHVLGEKPMADSMEHACQMVAAAESAGRLYAVIQNRRYDPRIRRLRSFLASDQLGRLTTVNSDFYLGAHFGGFRDAMEHVLLLDMAIHTFDAARLISAADPVSVYAKEWNPSGSWYAHGASAVAVFEMTGGLVYAYRGSWCAEGLNTTWECAWRVIGEQGSARWDGADAYEVEVVNGNEGFIRPHDKVEIPPYQPSEDVGGHGGLIRDFVRCVQTGAVPETTCRDNIKSLAMVFGAIESANSGKTETIKV